MPDPKPGGEAPKKSLWSRFVAAITPKEGWANWFVSAVESMAGAHSMVTPGNPRDAKLQAEENALKTTVPKAGASKPATLYAEDAPVKTVTAAPKLPDSGAYAAAKHTPLPSVAPVLSNDVDAQAKIKAKL